MQKDEKLNIICFSNQLWEFPLWTNKKHVMSHMAKLGHNVLFVDPPITTGRVFFKYLRAGNWGLYRLLTWQYRDTGVRIFTPLNFLPFFGLLSKLHAYLINRLAKKYFDPERKTVVWVYHVEIPGIESYLNNIERDVLVYDCVDNYAAFPRYDTPEKKEKIQNQENYLATEADVVFTTAPGLYDRMEKLNPNTHYTPNVGDYEKFSKAPNYANKLPEDLKEISRPRIGFAGSVDEYKFDRELVKKIAKEHPKYSFVILGPMGLSDQDATPESLGFADLKNVHFLGVRPYEILEQYYAGFDAYIIPYQLNDYTVGGCFPVKFHDALAVGLPIIVTDLPAYRPFARVSYISKNYDEFSKNIRKALDEDTDKLREERKKVAHENSWNGKVVKMLELLPL